MAIKVLSLSSRSRKGKEKEVKVKKNAKAPKVKKESKREGPITHIPRLVRLGALHYNENNELVVVAQKYHTYTVTHTYLDSKRPQNYYYNYILCVWRYCFLQIRQLRQIENFGFIFHYVEYLFPYHQDYSSLYSARNYSSLLKQKDARWN